MWRGFKKSRGPRIWNPFRRQKSWWEKALDPNSRWDPFKQKFVRDNCCKPGYYYDIFSHTWKKRKW